MLLIFFPFAASSATFHIEQLTDLDPGDKRAGAGAAVACVRNKLLCSKPLKIGNY